MDSKAADFLLDFSFRIPPKSSIQISVEQKEYAVGKLIPFCEALKGRVLSQFVDIERHIEHILSVSISPDGSSIPRGFTFRELIRPLNLERKISILKRLCEQGFNKSYLPEDFFLRLNAAREMRNTFAHGSILFESNGESVRAFLAADDEVTVDDNFSHRIVAENYALLETLNNWYLSLIPDLGVDIQEVAGG
jgi:hypothetical protein